MAEPVSDNNLQVVADIIVRDFEIERAPAGDRVSEEELLAILAEQIDYMIQYRLEHLFSLLYRMDVKEQLVRAAMAPEAPEPANWGIARLVLERQKQRNRTKATIKTQKLDEDEAWEW